MYRIFAVAGLAAGLLAAQQTGVVQLGGGEPVSPASPASAAESGSGPVFDVHALLSLAQISDPQLSPDGTQVAYVVQRVSEVENAKSKQIFTVPVEGGPARRLTNEGNNSRPRWAPDSSQLAFVSDRTESSQIWLMSANGSGQRPVTDLATEASGVLFSPAGDTLVFASRVFSVCGSDRDCNKAELVRANDGHVKARVFDNLL